MAQGSMDSGAAAAAATHREESRAAGPAAEPVEVGENGEFSLVSEEGPLPIEFVGRVALRLPKLRDGLAALGVRPACSFPLVLHISPPGSRAPRNATASKGAGTQTHAYTRTHSQGLDFDRDFELVDRVVASQFLLGTSAPPPQWAWLVDGTLGCLVLRSMAKAEQFQMNAAALSALREQRAPPRPDPAAPPGPAAHGQRRGSNAAAVAVAPAASVGPGGASKTPKLARVASKLVQSMRRESGSAGAGAGRSLSAAPNSLLSILSGPTPRNHACYRLLATSFVSFLAAAHPRAFAGDLLRYARQQIGPPEAPEYEPFLWEESGALLKGRRGFRIEHLERAWQEWVEGRVDGRRRGLSWVFVNAFRLMGSYPARIALSLLGLLCQLAMQGLLILSFARVVDAADRGDEAELRKYVILLASFGAASIVGSHAYAYIQSSVIARTLEDLQVELMRHLLAMPDSYLRDADDGSLLAYFASDVWALEPTLASIFRIVQAGATFSLQLALMFSLDYKIAPIVITIQLAVVLSQRAHNARVARASSDKQKSLTGVLSVVKEVVMGATVIRDYGMSEKTLAQFRESLALTTNALFRLRMHSMMYVTAIICFNQFLQGATLSAMGYLALNGAISKGQLSAIYLNVTTLGSASATIVNMVPEVTKGSGPLQRICAFLLIPEDEEIVAQAEQGKGRSGRGEVPVAPASMGSVSVSQVAPTGAASASERSRAPSTVDLEEEGPAGAARLAPRTALAALRGLERQRSMKLSALAEGELEGAGPMGEGRAVEAIECRRVSFAYRSFDTRMILDAVSLTIRPCTSVCIVGGSGCGKSTLLGILMRNYRPTHGAVKYGGVKLHKIPRAVWKRHVRVVQQSAFIFGATARENIAIGKPGATDEEVAAAARLAQIHDVISELPEGYNTVINMKSLSGGQKQRICIARALIGEPKILVLDECTSALDAETERRINAMIEEASKRMTVIQVTHRLAAAEKCDEVIVLDKGHVVERGAYAELAKAGGPFSHLLSQAGEFEAPLGPARTPDEVAALLRRFDGFHEGPEDALRELAASASFEEYRKGDSVCEQDTPATHLDLVLSGLLEKERTGLEGKPHRVGTLKQGELSDVGNLLLAPASSQFSGEASGEGRAPWNHHSLLAASDARLLRLPLLAVNRYLRGLTAAELARAFPHLEEGRRALYNWKRGRVQLGNQLAFVAAAAGLSAHSRKGPDPGAPAEEEGPAPPAPGTPAAPSAVEALGGGGAAAGAAAEPVAAAAVAPDAEACEQAQQQPPAPPSRAAGPPVGLRIRWDLGDGARPAPREAATGPGPGHAPASLPPLAVHARHLPPLPGPQPAAHAPTPEASSALLRPATLAPATLDHGGHPHERDDPSHDKRE